MPISLTTGTAGRPIALAGVDAANIVVTPDGHTAYLTAGHSRDILRVDLATRTIERPIRLGGAPSGIVMAPSGHAVYAVTGSVYRIDVATGAVGPPISIPSMAGPWGIAMGPAGPTAYVQAGQNLYSIPLAGADSSFAVSPGGHTAYLVGKPGLGFGCSVVPVNLRRMAAETPISVAGPNNYCYDLAVTPRGNGVVVTDTVAGSPTTPNTGRAFLVDVRTRAVAKPVPLPAGIMTGPGALVMEP
ncbi:MAG: YncE family protein [Acidimicrobiales bacterium]